MAKTRIIGQSDKAQQHLSLLREEYRRLQERCIQLEQKLAKALASSPNGQEDDDSFLSQFYTFFYNLYGSEEYSDLTIRLPEGDVRAHRLVLAARGNFWGVASLADIDILDWMELEKGVGAVILRWIYTDNVSLGDHMFALKVICAAAKFKLEPLVKRCEEALIAWVTVKNCIQLYTTADDIGAPTLKHHCSTLISTYWNDFAPEDFLHMSAPLLYEMFKSKTDYVLHASVRLQREDVLFLFLIEFSAQAPSLLNSGDDQGRLALDLALEARHSSIARTLLSHGASINARDSSGDTPLHAAVKRGDDFAVSFLLENDAEVNVVNKETKQSALHLIAGQRYDRSEAEMMMTATAKEMLQLGADLNLQDTCNRTPLHLAVENSKAPLFEVFINHEGVEVDLTDKHDLTSLWYALLNGENFDSDSFAAHLIKKGACLDHRVKEERNCFLHLLAKEGREQAGLFLVSKGASPSLLNVNGENPLHISCQTGLPLLTEALLKAGCDPNRQTYPATPADSSIENPFAEDSSLLIYRQSPLHIAIRNGNFQDAYSILKQINAQDNDTLVPDLTLMDSSGLTPLGVALFEDHSGSSLSASHSELAIAILKERGCDVNQLDPNGYSLLHRSISQCREEVAIFLLQNGADPNFRTRDKNVSPLEMAIYKNLIAVVESLCKNNCDFSASGPVSLPPLWLALQQNNTQIAETLIRFSADADAWQEGSEGCLQTLLHRAIDENREDIACFLIENGCSVDALQREGPTGRGADVAKDKQTPLHMCCSWGLVQAAKSLVMFGAKLNSKDVDSKTPFHLALENNHLDLISFLLDQPSLDLSIRDREGKTPFAAAMIMKNSKAAQAILRKHPSAAEQPDHKGYNFLHTAIQKGDLESVLFLLSVHVNLTTRTKGEKQLTPLHLATLQGNEMIVRNLLLAGAKINDLTPQKQNCLHLAALSDHSHLCTIFLQNDIDVDAMDDNHNNALHVAIKEGHLSTVRVLLTESQINAGAVNLRGQNPLHVLSFYPKDNAAALFNLFMEALPNYPIDLTDLEGNSALLLAYMRGAGQLCRSLVKARACLGVCNKQGVHLFNYQVATKALLCRLLDCIQADPPWSEAEFCLECGCQFGIATRRHHCRHCGRSVCSKCSGKEIPILKFGINKPVRVCQICFDILTIGTGAYS